MKTNLTFALDVQELSKTDSTFEENVITIMLNYLGEIDAERSTNTLLVFKDASACLFEGHFITLTTAK